MSNLLEFTLSISFVVLQLVLPMFRYGQARQSQSSSQVIYSISKSSLVNFVIDPANRSCITSRWLNRFTTRFKQVVVLLKFTNKYTVVPLLYEVFGMKYFGLQNRVLQRNCVIDSLISSVPRSLKEPLLKKSRLFTRYYIFWQKMQTSLINWLIASPFLLVLVKENLSFI